MGLVGDFVAEIGECGQEHKDGLSHIDMKGLCRGVFCRVRSRTLKSIRFCLNKKHTGNQWRRRRMGDMWSNFGPSGLLDHSGYGILNAL